MRLCDAIRKGCEGTYQSMTYFDGNGGCCAIGAVAIALGDKDKNSRYLGLGDNEALGSIRKKLPILEKDTKYPIAPFDVLPLYIQISALNTHAGWTREAIADWVEKEFESSARLTDPESKDEPVLQEVLKESVSG